MLSRGIGLVTLHSRAQQTLTPPGGLWTWKQNSKLGNCSSKLIKTWFWQVVEYILWLYLKLCAIPVLAQKGFWSKETEFSCTNQFTNIKSSGTHLYIHTLTHPYKLISKVKFSTELVVWVFRKKGSWNISCNPEQHERNIRSQHTFDNFECVLFVRSLKYWQKITQNQTFIIHD